MVHTSIHFGGRYSHLEKRRISLVVIIMLYPEYNVLTNKLLCIGAACVYVSTLLLLPFVCYKTTGGRQEETARRERDNKAESEWNEKKNHLEWFAHEDDNDDDEKGLCNFFCFPFPPALFFNLPGESVSLLRPLHLSNSCAAFHIYAISHSRFFLYFLFICLCVFSLLLFLLV